MSAPPALVADGPVYLASRLKIEGSKFRPLQARLMATDGTLSRDSFLIDVSNIRAEIELPGPAADLSEFYVLLTTFGNPVYRRCKREGVNGSRLGVKFIKSSLGNKSLE
jgi:hypothetical protein